MKLILVRHAKAMDRVKALLKEVDDANRPLTKKGKLKFEAHAESLKKEFAGVDLFVTSEYVRAKETLEILLGVLTIRSAGKPVATKALAVKSNASEAQTLKVKSNLSRPDVFVLKGITPDSSPDNLVKWLRTRAEKKLLVVGHEPFLSKFLSKQAKKPFKDKIKKGAVIVADVHFTPAGEFILKVDEIFQP